MPETLTASTCYYHFQFAAHFPYGTMV